MAPEATSRQQRAGSEQEGEPFLFDLPAPQAPKPKVSLIRNAIWTEHKARLIERYLYLFVMITHHGCYIDGFAGPQQPDNPEAWAAKLVLESQPKWLRHFHLFERNVTKVRLLHELREAHAGREVMIYEGDFNERVLELLSSGAIEQNEATFCLLDQQTFECHWRSLQALAGYKTSGYKIELFYFFANHWLDRALAAQKDVIVLENWWGSTGWECLRQLSSFERVQLVARRIECELGYNSVKPWPIYQRKDGGHIMYFMIHATDHENAPALMRRAYEQAVSHKAGSEQLSLDLWPHA